MLKKILLIIATTLYLYALDFHFESQRPPGSEGNREITGPRSLDSTNTEGQGTQDLDSKKSKKKPAVVEICQILETCRLDTCIYLCRYVQNVYVKYVMTNMDFAMAYRRRLELSNSMDYLRAELPSESLEYSVPNLHNEGESENLSVKYEYQGQNKLTISLNDKGEVIGMLVFERVGDKIIIYDSMSQTKSTQDVIDSSMRLEQEASEP